MNPRAAGQPIPRLEITVQRSAALRFDDDTPVRAASGIAPCGDGWLVAQDDANHAAWWRHDEVTALRLFPPVDGHDHFSAPAGTKRLKPDLEAACSVTVDGRPGTLLLGSGSLANRTRAALVTVGPDGPTVRTADLAALYDRVADAMGVAFDRRNLEGACVLGDSLRWFQRGDVRSGVPDASVDVDLAGLLTAITGTDLHPGEVPLGAVRRYDLGEVTRTLGAGGGGSEVPLAITDAVALADGRVLVAAASEDTDDPVADGVVSAAALVVLDGTAVTAAATVPHRDDGHPRKIEGLAISRERAGAIDLLAVADEDDPALASPVLHLTVAGP